MIHSTKKWPVFVILMPVMTKPSGPGSFLRKYGCRGCWGLWGRRGHWGQWGCRGLLGLENHYWVIQVLEINSLRTYITYFGVLKRQFFWQNHENPCWILVFFLSEVVEASPCYFFKNWLVTHKSPNLLKPLGTIIYQNSQFYYPSEPFSFHHFNVRHPV